MCMISYHYLIVSCKKSDGTENLRSFLIDLPVGISYIPLCKRTFKTEGSYLKFLHTVNVDFVVSELPEEQFSHVKFSNNDSLK